MVILIHPQKSSISNCSLPTLLISKHPSEDFNLKVAQKSGLPSSVLATSSKLYPYCSPNICLGILILILSLSQYSKLTGFANLTL